MSMEKWIHLDVDKIEPAEVTQFEKARIKQAVINHKKRKFRFQPILASAIAGIGLTAVMGFSFPSVAAQIPFMNQVMTYFQDTNTEAYEVYSTNLGLSQTSNGIEVMIDKAVYDGTTITIAFAVDTGEMSQNIGVATLRDTSIDGAAGLSGSTEVISLQEGQYAGLAMIAPDFEGGKMPEQVQVQWNPEFLAVDQTSIAGDWSFEFALNRIDGNVKLVNQVTQTKDITFTLDSMEQTPISTILHYEQITSAELFEQWSFINPVFRVTDNLGNVYLEDESGSGVATEEGTIFKGSTTFGALDEEAEALIIEPFVRASLGSGEGHEVFELETITIDLTN